jgi:uncharacterized protein (TIGR00251 family)
MSENWLPAGKRKRLAELDVEQVGGGVRFFAKIIPGSSKTALCGIYDRMLKVKVVAAPEKGKANKCLSEFLAKQLGIKKNAVTIISGQTSPIKQIQINGVSIDNLNELLGFK